MNLIRSFKFFLLSMLCGLAAFAQQGQPLYNVGFTPYSAYQGGDIDHISLYNGSLSFEIPLVGYPQRGGKLRLGYMARYNSKYYTMNSICDTDGTNCQYYLLHGSNNGNGWSVPKNTTGFAITDDQQLTRFTLQYKLNPYTSGTSWRYYYPLEVISPDGGVHYGDQLSGTTTQVTLDGSAIMGLLPNSSDQTATRCCGLIDAEGIAYSPATGVIRQDPNGNQIVSGVDGNGNPVVIDTVGRTIPSIPAPVSGGDSTGCTGTLPTSAVSIWQTPGANSSTLTYKFCYAQVSVYIPAALCGLQSDFVNTPQLMQSILLPNGTSWTFEYNARATGDASNVNYGEVSKITFPTGGTISYGYKMLLVGSVACSAAISSRTVNANDGQGDHTWQYDPGDATGILTDPEGNQSSYSFGPNGEVVEEDFNQKQSDGSQKLIKKVSTQYISSSALNVNEGTEIGVYPQTVTTTLDTGLVSKRTYDYCCSYTFLGFGGWDGAHANIGGETINYGLQSDVKDYDFGQGSPGPLLREVSTNYLWSTNNSYQTANLLHTPSSVVTKDGSGNQVASTVYTYDEPNYLTGTSVSTQHVGVSGPRGNPTTTANWLNGGTDSVSHINWYDTGVPYQSIDPKNNTTTYTYSSSYAGSLPTSVSNALGQNTTTTYDLNMGLKSSVTDPNNQTTSWSYDNLGRLVSETRPDVASSAHGQTNYCYSDTGGATCSQSGPPYSMYSSTLATPNPTIAKVQTFDGLGRPFRSILQSDPGGPTMIDTTYDDMGRVASVSNPYRSTSEATYGLTQYLYDALGRKTVQTQPDGNKQQWCYDGIVSNGQKNCTANKSNLTNSSWVDFSDETGSHWQHAFDGLGRLAAVMEPDGSTNIAAVPSQETDYQYDALDNLTHVNQHGLVRSFTYDSLSRLATSSNPESGTVTYGYDPNGNVQSKTDARGIQTAYSYDALNRLTSKTYSDGTPAAHFNYDETTVTVGSGFWGGPHPNANPIGRMTSWYVGSSAPGLVMKSFSYDAMGRPNSSWQCWGPTECSSTYGTVNIWATYDLAGNLTTMNNGQDAQIDYTYDSAGQLQTAVYKYLDQQPNPTVPLVTSATYTASGQPATRNGNESWTYDKRLRVTSYTNKSSPTSSTVNAGYSLTYSPNGNVQSDAETAGSVSPVWNYTYDNLNRLSTAVTNPPFTEGCQESYDTFGNRTSQQPYGGSGYLCGSSSLSFTGNGTVNNNRIDGYCYDASGNLLDDGPCPASGGHKYTYDAEGRMATALYGSIVSTYGADGLRSSTGDSGQTPTNFFYDFSGKILAHGSAYGQGLSFGPQELWINGAHFGSIDLGNTSPVVPKLTLSITDWLGTERVRTDASNNVQAIFCNLPFGDFLTTCYGTDPYPADITHFTGKERDIESGLDYFGARYYSSNMGRMMSPDWAAKAMPVPYARLDNPQSLNLYAYVGNNPLRYTDPTGHYLVNCGAKDKACNKAADGFEKQRQKDLKSKDVKVRNAASAWGDRGQDNHINVSFVSQQQMDADAHTAPGYRTDAMVTPGTTADHTPTITAEFSENLTGSDLGQTISHEGQHIEDDMTFLNSFNPATGKYNPFANFSHFDTEFQAFSAGAGVKPYSMFPSGPGGYQQLTDYIRRAYPNADQQVFSPRAFPQ